MQLGANTTFDPGGIGKGFAADLLVSELLSSGARGALVSVGGDLGLECPLEQIPRIQKTIIARARALAQPTNLLVDALGHR